MATLARLLKMKEEIVDDVYDRINEAEANRVTEYQAAVKIQSWFRAQRIRSYISHLHQAAVAIQGRWRGFQHRLIYRQMLQEAVAVMKLKHYNAMATTIQKMWRGFYTRKYTSNYYSRKRYLEALQVKNEAIREELNEHAEQLEQRKLWKREEEEAKRLRDYASKNHYLLSTTVMPGVYNSPFQPYPDEMEHHLRHAKPRSPKKNEETTIYDPGCTRYDLPQLNPLPPIQAKPQGPFRDLRNVQKQRYKQFQPSLRVATSYISVEEAREKMKKEEWVARVNDNIFVPFTRKSVPYDSLLHTTSKYGHLPYGAQYYREEFPEQFCVPQNFQTVVPPIPIFDKLNDTYSQGQV